MSRHDAVGGTGSAAPLRSVPLRRHLLQGAPGRDGVGVVGAEDALADGEGALEEGAGCVRIASSKEAGEVVKTAGGVRVMGPEIAFADGQNALEQGMCPVQLTQLQ